MHPIMLTKEQDKAGQILWATPKTTGQTAEKSVVQLIAGAGSGKTATLIESVCAGLRNNYPAREICLITFTRKAATEMQNRLKIRQLSVGYAGTMHRLGFQLLKSTPGFEKTILAHKETALKTIIQQHFPELSHIPADVVLPVSAGLREKHSQISHLYRLYKEKNHLMDLDDLIRLTSAYIKEDRLHFPYSCIFLDEFQDTSPDQMELIRTIYNTNSLKKLFVVGDDWQSIYKFRGADVNIALNFKNYFPNAVRIYLTENFRSQKKIVKMGNSAIQLSRQYIPKKLKAHNKPSFTPTCHIVKQRGNAPLAEMTGIWKDFYHGYLRKKFGKDLTILVRTNHLRRYLQEITGVSLPILTIHSAKGLEFDNVLIFGVAKNIFPHHWNDFNEEVRLLYVAITRAKHNLEFFSWEKTPEFSAFMPFLTRFSKIHYL